MRLCRVRRLATFGLVSSLVGCTAVSDFDYSFHPSEGKDGGGDASQPDLDAQVPLDSGPRADAANGDATVSEDGAVCSGASCCQITEINEVSCGDGLDNDCDGKGDCADDDCRQSAKCCPNPTLESGDMACADGKDNDCDGLTDCQESGCAGVYKCTCVVSGAEDGKNFPARCLDMKDNDCNHLTDCADNACAPYSGCCTPTPGQLTIETSCSDGINNDCDAVGADCADPDCRMSTDAGAAVMSEMGAAACSDKVDDDCDGLVDCKDDDCHAELVCCVKTAGQESVETSCGDGINNDCDASGADCFDSDCALDANCCKPVSGGESTEALCTNGVDDDCDGLVDCGDPNCNRTVHCCPRYLKANGQTLQTTETSCTDAYDNDCDGLLNCADSVDCPVRSCLIIVRPPIIIDPGPIEATQ